VKIIFCQFSVEVKSVGTKQKDQSVGLLWIDLLISFIEIKVYTP
jgi:hypothetical protein